MGQTNRTNRTTGGISGVEAAQVNFTLEVDPRRAEREHDLVNEAVFIQEVPSLAEEQYRTALGNFESGDRAGAALALLRALEIFPNYFAALERLGGEHLNEQNYAEAASILSRAVEVNPRSVSAAYGLATAQYSLKRWTDAEGTLEKLVALNPSSVNSFYLLGKVRRNLGKFPAAEEDLRKANELGKGQLPDIHWELALLYYHNLKRYNDAADELELYLKTNPKAENKEQVRKLIAQIRKRDKG